MIRQIKFLFLVSIIVCIAACNDDSSSSSGSSSSTPSSSVSSSGDVYLVDSSKSGTVVSLSHTVGSTAKDVYFVFTNTSDSDSSTLPALSNISASGSYVAADRNYSTALNSYELGLIEEEMPTYEKGWKVASEWNANPPELMAGNQNILGEVVSEPSYVKDYSIPENQNQNFYTTKTGTTAFTFRSQTNDGGITVNIWVANDSWDANGDGICDTPGSKSNCMTPTMVSEFKEKFFKAGSDNDIYDWVKNIYGAPWGAHSYTNHLIPPDEYKQINILFYDIDDDDSTTGGTLGFYWAKDNYKKTTFSYSNEGLFFYMDSVLAAESEGGSWEISDTWPKIMVSTLAHEFQHMIHFYQKTIKRAGGTGSDTWLNEMVSMVTEDLVATKMKVDGPRGVDYSYGSSGGAGNTSGRMPRFNNFNYYGVTDWNSSSPLPNYSINYALGAYLGRNYGGANFFQKLVQNDKTSTNAVDQALSDLGYSDNFTTAMKRWGAAVILSDQTDNATYYKYNTGAYSTSSIGGITYSLGSINLYNYNYGSLSGPRIFTETEMENMSIFYKRSNILVKVGENVTGTFTSTVNLPDNVELTVVLK